jgi:Flp pilus assembly protein TadG
MKVLEKYVRGGNQRGIAVIYIALMLFALCGIVALAIDIGYMYSAKTQLQNAADSAAHAGTSKLLELIVSGGVITNLNDSRIITAKNEAVSFALNNMAAGDNIVILNDGSNQLSDTNDVTAGYWDNTSYTANTTPVNAIQARARRTENSPGGKIAVFFGKIIGFPEMAAAASAVAALPLRGGTFISMCSDVCSACPTFCSYSSGKQYDTGPTGPYSDKFAWTTLLDDPTAANKLATMMCTEKPAESVCNKNIYSSMGTVASTVKDFASLFYNTSYDAANKTFTTINGNKIVTGWEVIVPITRDCPPGAQGNAWDPKHVDRYAKVNFTAVCATGVSAGCYGQIPNLNNACNNEDLPAKNCCDNFDNNSIVVDRIECVPCDDPSIFSGTRPIIVK